MTVLDLKRNLAKYNDSDLDFGFTFILQNGEEKPNALYAARYWPVRACYIICLNVI